MEFHCVFDSLADAAGYKVSAIERQPMALVSLTITVCTHQRRTGGLTPPLRSTRKLTLEN